MTSGFVELIREGEEVEVDVQSLCVDRATGAGPLRSVDEDHII